MKDNVAMQVAEKREETLETLELAIRDWSKMGFKQKSGVLSILKFDSKYLRPEDLEMVKKKFIAEGMVSEKTFDGLVKKGRQLEGIPEFERGFEEVDQAKLNRLLEEAIPKEGFIKDYIDTFSEITDTPKAFLFWGVMVTVATVLGKNAYVKWETRKLYPNIWCVFLAPSGFRKGTGVDIPTRLLRKVNQNLLLPQVGSEEGLTKALAKETEGQDVGFVRWQEFSRILKGWLNKQSWQANQEFWIDLWDNKGTKKKLSGGEFNIPETSISFLSACTPKTFSTFFKPPDLEGGFFGRVYLITCSQKKHYFPIPLPLEDGAFSPLVKQLHEIEESFKEDEFFYSEFEDAFSRWGKETQKNHQQGYLDSFYSRIETHCMKLAMIYEAATTGKVHITKESFVYAVNAIEFLIASAYPLVSEEIGLSEEEKKVSLVAKYIRDRGEVRRSEIMQNLHLVAFNMDNIERTLLERELIEIEKPSGQRGPPRKIYFWSSNSSDYK